MHILLVAVIATLLSFSTKAAEPIPEMVALAPYVGTWEQVLTDGSTEQPDIQKWEWAFKGKVVRILHGNGNYGGESLIHWDGVQQKILFRYVTNDGFYTDGVMTPTETGFDVIETIGGAKAGPSEVRSAYSITAEGRLQIKARFKMNGKWQKGFTNTYKHNADAVVRYDN